MATVRARVEDDFEESVQGHAVVILVGWDGPTEGVVYAIERSHARHPHLGRAGWQPSPEWLTPDRVVVAGAEVRLHIGPDVVGIVEPHTTVFLRLGVAGSEDTVQTRLGWGDITPPYGGPMAHRDDETSSVRERRDPKIGGAVSAGLRSDFPPPPPPAKVPPPPPTPDPPQPEPLPEPTPQPLRKVPDDGTQKRDDTKKTGVEGGNGRGLAAMVVGVLLFLGLVAYFLMGPDDTERHPVASPTPTAGDTEKTPDAPADPASCPKPYGWDAWLGAELSVTHALKCARAKGLTEEEAHFAWVFVGTRGGIDEALEAAKRFDPRVESAGGRLPKADVSQTQHFLEEARRRAEHAKDTRESTIQQDLEEFRKWLQEQ